MANRSSNQTRCSRRSQRQHVEVLFLALSALFAFFALNGLHPAAQAPDRARTEALARRAGERLVALQREADRLAREEGTLLNNLRKLEVERQIRTEEFRQ